MSATTTAATAVIDDIEAHTGGVTANDLNVAMSRVVVEFAESGVTASESGGATGAATAVAMTTASATLIAANASRVGLMIYNPLAVTLYVRFENADAATVQSFWVLPGETYEMPRRYYTGIVKAATASSSGSVFVTEIV
jgi:hypothetical protein